MGRIETFIVICIGGGLGYAISFALGWGGEGLEKFVGGAAAALIALPRGA